MIKIKMQYKILGIIFLFLCCNQLNAQDEVWHTDFTISYFPKITAISYQKEPLMRTVSNGEFNETLDILVKSIFGKDNKIQRISSMRMKSGIAPRELKTAERWIRIEITKEGKIALLEIYNQSKRATDELSKSFVDLLKTARINPAIANNQEVNCRLYYLILKE